MHIKILSKLIVPALLIATSVAMINFQYQKDQVEIDLSAFINLRKNLDVISEASNKNIVTTEAITTNDEIRKIENNLTRVIANSKKIKTKVSPIVFNKPAITDEINNQEIVVLKKISTDKKEFVKFDDQVIDEVVIASSATEKESGPIEPDSEVISSDTSMEMYEYQAPVSTKKIETLYDRELSPAVKEAITRIAGPSIKKHEETNDQIVYDYRPAKAAELNNEKKPDAFVNNFTQNASFEISANEIGKNQKLSSFFTPDYNREERVDSNKDGLILLNWQLTEGVSTQTGIVEASGMVPTRVEINLNTQSSLQVPMISVDEHQKSYDGKTIILLAINDEVEETDIDAEYDKKIYLDEQFIVSDIRAKASYVLYSGVNSGNVLLKYHLKNNETAQKVIYIGEREVYFEEGSFAIGERELYTFKTRNALSTKTSDLSISPELINVFNTNITSKKKTLSTYELKMPTQVTGSRKYIEMKHLHDSIFIGTDKKAEIDVPNNEFIAKVLEVNEVSTLRDRCVLQVNLSKQLDGLTVNGKNRSGEMYTEISALDEEGNFTKSEYAGAKKVFVVGDLEGIFNAKFEYSDGSVQFLKSFCSEGTYIVEEL